MFPLFILLASPPTQAAELTVCTEGCAHSSLDAAIEAASAGDTITLDDSATWTLGVGIDKDLSIVGKGASRPVVHRSGSGGWDVVLFDRTVSLEGIQLTNADGLGSITNLYGTLTLRDVVLKDSTLSAPAFLNIGGTVVVEGGEYSGNTASAIFRFDDWSRGSLSGTTIQDNTTGGSTAGTIEFLGAELSLDDVTLEGNVAPNGAIRVKGSAGDCALSITDSRLRNNRGTEGPGGIAFPANGCTASFSGNTIEGNTHGGGDTDVPGWPDCSGVDGCGT